MLPVRNHLFVEHFAEGIVVPATNTNGPSPLPGEEASELHGQRDPHREGSDALRHAGRFGADDELPSAEPSVFEVLGHHAQSLARLDTAWDRAQWVS